MIEGEKRASDNSNGYVEFGMQGNATDFSEGAHPGSAKVRKTKRRITDRLFALMSEDSIERITVGEVCAAAHVNRSTFYHHFDSIYDARDACEAEVEATIGVVLPCLMEGILLGDRELAAAYFEERMGPYYGYLNVLLNGGDPAFVVRVRAIAYGSLKRTLGIECFSERQEFIFNAVAGMQIGIIGHWLATGRSMPITELLDLIGVLVREGPRTALIRG